MKKHRVIQFAAFVLISIFSNACAVAQEQGQGSEMDKRFNVEWTITVPGTALSVTDFNPDNPREPLGIPDELGAYEFWIKKSALNATFGKGKWYDRQAYITIGLLAYDIDKAAKLYEWLKEKSKSDAPVTLTLVGDQDYLHFTHGKAVVPYDGLFLKVWAPVKKPSK